MTAGKFHHFGVPSATRRPGELYLETAGVHVTDPEQHPYKVEFVRFDADSPLPQVLKTRAHAAFVVPSLDEAIKGHEVVVPPFDATDALRAAFILDGDALLELLEERRK